MSTPRIYRKLYNWDEVMEVMAVDTLSEHELFDDCLHVLNGKPYEIQMFMTKSKSTGQPAQMRIEVTLPATGGTDQDSQP